MPQISCEFIPCTCIWVTMHSFSFPIEENQCSLKLPQIWGILLSLFFPHVFHPYVIIKHKPMPNLNTTEISFITGRLKASF